MRSHVSEPNDPATTSAMQDDLATLQRETFDYFIHEANPANGLILDKTEADWPASIAATGLALSCYPVGVERGFMSRAAAVERTLTTLRFFWNSSQGPEPDATGYRGFYYHFLDMQTGRRAWQCELSTIDSTLLLAGALAAGQYFDADTEAETEIRTLANALFCRADWRWARNGGETVTHGWTPERGFIKYRWEGYDEALLLYVLGLGSPTYPLPESSYSAWTATFRWEQCYGYDYLYAGPLFIHQLSHVWIDLRGLQDAFMRSKGSDYFENSRRATFVQQRYAIDNPRGFEGYGEHCWGITASEGPGPSTLRRARSSLRSRRWHARSVGHRRFLAFCAGNRPASDQLLHPPGQAQGRQGLWVQGGLQSDASGDVRRCFWMVDFTLAFRPQRRARRPDDRE